MPDIDLPADGEKPYGTKLRTAINAVNDAVDAATEAIADGSAVTDSAVTALVANPASDTRAELNSSFATAAQGTNADQAIPNTPAGRTALAESTELSTAFGGIVETLHEVPSALGWDSRVPIDVSLRQMRGDLAFVGDIGLTPEQLFDLFSTARSAPATTYWVSADSGSDSNTGLSSVQAFRTIGKAIVTGNASGQPYKVKVSDGTLHFDRNNGFTNASGVPYVPTQDVAFVSLNQVLVASHDNSYGFAVDGTYGNCYTKSVSTVLRVLDLAARNEYGDYVQLQRVTTAARCNATPNSWALVSGVLYVNRRDGAAPSAANLRYYRATPVVTLTNEVNVYIGSDGGSGRWEFEGGSTSPLNVSIANPTAGAFKALVVANASFCYGGAAVSGAPAGTSPDGVSIVRWPGVAAFFNCTADANAKDGFNAHNQSPAATISLLLTVNCRGFDNGRGEQSCNGLTLHETMIGTDVAGRYGAGHGGTIRNIGSSRQLLVGTIIEGDAGDLSAGGFLRPTAVRVDDSAEIWADRAVVRMKPGELAWVAAETTAKIHKRNCAPTGQPDFGSGVFDSY